MIVLSRSSGMEGIFPIPPSRPFPKIPTGLALMYGEEME
jgi:hypothetical protein